MITWKCPNCDAENNDRQMMEVEDIGTIFECVACNSVFSGYLSSFVQSDLLDVELDENGDPIITVEVKGVGT